MAKRPDYFCNWPKPQGQQVPCIQKQSELRMFLYTEEFPETSDLNWLIASTENITVGEYQLSPGSHFSPADVHAGDEIYYVMKGEVTMFQPESGQVMVVGEGEGILMPKGCPHIGYNFTEDKSHMLYAIAPKIWGEDGPPSDYTGAVRLYKFEERGGSVREEASPVFSENAAPREGMRIDLGHFPASGPEGREKKLFYKLTEQNGIKMISGTKTPALMSVWASNDVMQFGTIKILTGGPAPQQTEYDTHAGDAIFYVMDGPATFFLPDRTQTFNVEPGDFMFIPQGERYKIINYYGHTAKVLFFVAPEF
ncbi:MAG: cupin domain-containing protein [Lachnospiraceae bacterium]|nr:cupin domain-containing protein [Lachnospiraceae bacterium]